MISLIVAISQNNAIGADNRLLYRLPNDMKRFKELTTGHTIIMGRKTFESFPKGALPNRRNVIISHNTEQSYSGAEVLGSLEEALCSTNPEDEVFIIGGASIYRQALSLANKLYLTVVDDLYLDADAFFPLTNSEEWIEKAREVHEPDEKHAFRYTFIDCVRKR